MRLKRLEISGFKSFAKKTTLDFDVPITSIVGPNGSGKSNVAESLRWVLGEQSMKSLRGKRGEDLIFNGASAGSRLNHASVSLVFDNKDKVFPLEFSEVTVSREVYRDGSNTYLINGSQVRLRDVVELLSSVALGASGHHIISQGEADRVLSANPRERREIIEDALGLKIYQFKLSESGKRLEKTEENIKQVESLRREIAPHLKFLKKQVEEVEKVATMKSELGTLATEYFSTEKVYLDGLAAAIGADWQKARNELKETESKLAEARRALEAADKGAKERDPRIKELEDKIAAARTEKDENSRAIGRLEGKIESIKVEEFVVIDRATGKEQCKYCGQEIVRKGTSAAAEAEKTHLQEEKRKLEENLKRAAGHERALIDELDAFRVSLSRQTTQAREVERSLYELKGRESTLRAEQEKIALRESQYKMEHEVFVRDSHEVALLSGVNVLSGTSHNRSREEQTELRKRIERLKIKVEDAGGVGTDVIREYDETRARDEHLAKELEDLDKSSESLKQLMKELTETLETKFKEGLALVNKEFNTFFEMLFGGGRAGVSVVKIGGGVDEAGEEIETQWGIDIDVNLPRKKIRGLEMLSGGERALTSIALLFAMSQVNPPPFLVLDETDAALDEANSRKYGQMLENLSQKSQLIVVTHNRETMSHASVLYGVTMGADGISKLLSIRFDDAAQYAK